ncbi:MAG: vWA domain-containing protein, partial [Planctomycetota bacterium]
AAGPVLEGERTRPRELLVAVHGEESIRPSAPGMEREVLVHAHADGATAVAGAMAMRTPGSNARLLLITDGRGPGTEAMATALRGALQSGTPVLIRERTRSGVAAAPPAAGLAGVTLPRALAPGVPFSPRWNWDPAGADTRGWTVSTRVNGKALDAQDAAAPPRELKLGPGVHILEVDARDASGSDRGRVRLPVVIPGAARVVVVDEPNGSLTLSAALRAQGLEVERRRPADPVPDGPASLFVLGPGADTEGLGKAAETLAHRIRDGAGLLVLGGPTEERSAGRLRDSGLEPLLPVFLPPPAPPEPDPPPEPPDPDTPAGDDPGLKVDEGERPGARITLLLLVDTSGSMHGLKLEMARRAAAAAAASVGPEDRFGLITFTERASWKVPPMPAGNVSAIGKALRGLRASGNTDLLPALKAARVALARETTGIKHCIVFSDGETSPFGLRRVVDAMVVEGATLSTIGIGAEFDVRLLGNLAQWGKGRTYPAVDPRRLPQVVTLDTRRVVADADALSKSEPAPDLTPPETDLPEADPEKDTTAESDPETPGPVAVVPVDPSALLEDLGSWPAAVPPVAAPEPRLATTVALGFENDGGPVLVLGRHGLGRTAVLVPGADGGLGDDPASWHRWEGWAAAMTRLARGLAPVPPPSPVEVVDRFATESGTRVTLRWNAPRDTVLDE